MARKNNKKGVIIGILFSLLLVVIAIDIWLGYGVFVQRTQSSNVFDAAIHAEQMKEYCTIKSDSDRCYVSQFALFTKEHPLEQAVATLTKLQTIEPSTQNCHIISHKIASAEVEKNPEKWLDVLKRVDLSTCTRGYFHGAIEGYMEEHPEFMLTNKSIPVVCSGAVEATRANLTTVQSEQLCIHAVGHMLLVQEEADIKKAIGVCATLVERMRFECYSGVFMENMNKENLAIHGLSTPSIWNPSTVKEQESICFSYNDEPAVACWRDISNMYASLSNYSYNAVTSQCQKAPIKDARERCELEGVSFLSYLIVSQQGYSKLLADACRFADTDILVNKCLSYVVSYLMNSSLQRREDIKKYCDLLIDKDKKACQTYLAYNLSQAR